MSKKIFEVNYSEILHNCNDVDDAREALFFLLMRYLEESASGVDNLSAFELVEIAPGTEKHKVLSRMLRLVEPFDIKESEK